MNNNKLTLKEFVEDFLIDLENEMADDPRMPKKALHDVLLNFTEALIDMYGDAK